MLRSILAVLFGVIGGAAIAALPFGAKFAVVLASFAGAFGGGVIASLISGRWAPAAWVVAATILLFAGTNFSAFPHPLWMMVASIPATALGGWLAVVLTRARFGRPPAPAANKGLF